MSGTSKGRGSHTQWLGLWRDSRPSVALGLGAGMGWNCCSVGGKIVLTPCPAFATGNDTRLPPSRVTHCTGDSLPPCLVRACSKLRQISDSDLRKVAGCLPGKGLGKGGC